MLRQIVRSLSAVSLFSLALVTACGPAATEDEAGETEANLNSPRILYPAVNPPGVRGCYVWLSACKKYPTSYPLGSWFSDSWDGAGLDPSRCAVRARDYFAWCGNDLGYPTFSQYRAADGSLLVRNKYP